MVGTRNSDDRGIEFGLHVRPGGSRDAVDGEFDGVLAVRVSAAPEAGRANEAVRSVVADAFGVRRSAVSILAGATARRKRVRVDGDPAVLGLEHDRLMGRSRG